MQQLLLLQVHLMTTAAGMASSGISNVLLATDPLPQPINRKKPVVALGRSRAGWRTVRSCFLWPEAGVFPPGDRQVLFVLVFSYVEPAALSFRLGQSGDGC